MMSTLEQITSEGEIFQKYQEASKHLTQKVHKLDEAIANMTIKIEEKEKQLEVLREQTAFLDEETVQEQDGKISVTGSENSIWIMLSIALNIVLFIAIFAVAGRINGSLKVRFM